MATENKIGHVSHWFGNVQVAAIELTDGDLAVGDRIHVLGHTSNFIQSINSMQIDRAQVTQASQGQSVGIRVDQRARVGDEVFKVGE